MPLFPANKPFTALLALMTCCVFAAPSFAARANNNLPAPLAQQQAALAAMSQSLGDTSAPPAATKPNASRNARGTKNREVAPAPPSRSRTATTQAAPAQQSPAETRARLNDSRSSEYKADRLGRMAEKERALKKNLRLYSEDKGAEAPPMNLRQLQNIAQGDYRITNNISDIVSDGDPGADPAIDIRRDAQKEAALSFGARGGLAKRNYEIMQRLESFEATLDKVFNFRALLVAAPSGLLIEPPIVGESLDAMNIAFNGNEAAVADRIYDITKNAKIVSASRDWRTYLMQAWTARVPPPPRVLWPKNRQEQDSWDMWVEKGFRAGVQQADEMFEMNMNRLLTDYNGMVRYRTLLAQGMISQPYALHEDRGVTGDKTVMRVGDRAIRITGPSQFLMGSDLWKPADR